MLTRYGGGIDYIMNMEIERAIELIQKAYELHSEEKIFQRWINGYQNVDFKEFKDQLQPPKLTEIEFNGPTDVTRWIFNYFDEEVPENG